MATASSPVLPVAATPQVPAFLTKFGALTPDVIQQFQSAFQMDYRADLTLSSAQILALQTGAVQLLPAPGPGLMICPETIVMRMIGGTQYTDAGGAVSFNVGTMSAALAANTIFTGPSGAGARSQQIFAFNGTSTAASPPTNENAAMTISKATNNFAAGTGTMHITVFYTIETTT
jgi:hypothetical protein